jgi:hypothetical protein
MRHPTNALLDRIAPIRARPARRDATAAPRDAPRAPRCRASPLATPRDPNARLPHSVADFARARPWHASRYSGGAWGCVLRPGGPGASSPRRSRCRRWSAARRSAPIRLRCGSPSTPPSRRPPFRARSRDRRSSPTQSNGSRRSSSTARAPTGNRTTTRRARRRASGRATPRAHRPLHGVGDAGDRGRVPGGARVLRGHAVRARVPERRHLHRARVERRELAGDEPGRREVPRPRDEPRAIGSIGVPRGPASTSPTKGTPSPRSAT